MKPINTIYTLKFPKFKSLAIHRYQSPLKGYKIATFSKVNFTIYIAENGNKYIIIIIIILQGIGHSRSVPVQNFNF